MRTAIYTRVSTSDQVEDGFSLDAQLHRLNAFCTSQDWTVVGVYTDEGVSAKNTERPALQRMIQDIKNGLIDVVLVYKLDRLTRSVLDLQTLLETFDKYNVGFKSSTEVFDTTTASGRLFLTLVAAMAQWERETLGERVKMGMAQRARTGKWTGTIAPLGYRINDDGDLEIVNEEAEVVRQIFASYISGKGMNKIVQDLNESHALLRHWNQPRIRYILSNPVYTGRVRWGEYARSKVQMDTVLVQGTHEPIISDEVFDEVQHIKETRHKMPPRSGTGHYSLTGLLHCGVCGGAVIGKGYTHKDNGKMYRSYVCKNRQRGMCDTRTGNVNVIDELFIERLERFAANIQTSSKTKKPNVDTSHIEKELADIERRKKRWLDAFDNEQIDGATLNDRIRMLQDRESQLKERLASFQEDDSFHRREEALKLIQDIRALWIASTIEERRELARSLVESITITIHDPNHIEMDIDVRF